MGKEKWDLHCCLLNRRCPLKNGIRLIPKFHCIQCRESSNLIVTVHPIFKLRNLGIIEIGSTCLTVSIRSVDDYQLINNGNRTELESNSVCNHTSD